MKTLLVAPSIRQSTSWELPDGIPRSISRNFGIYPWLGLCYLSGFLKNAGLDSEIIDMDAEGLNIPMVCKKIYKIKPDLIGISTISFTFSYALRLAKEIKKHFNIPVVLGGSHISIYPKEAIQHDCIDIGVTGEGEETFLELVKILKRGDRNINNACKELRKVKGIVFKLNGEIITTEPRGFIRDIDSLPFPAIEKLRLERYYGCNHIRPYITMVTARGCKFNCNFCSKEPWGSTFRFHSAERVVDEIEYYIKNLGIKAIDFYDDTFTIPRSRIFEIVSLIKKRNIKFDFGLMTRVDCVDKELLLDLKSAGCKVIAYGVESGDKDIQNKVNKRLSVGIIRNAFKLANEIGIRTVGFFMIGHPDETENDIRNTISLMKEIKADYVKTNILIPYPGSQLYKQLLSSGNLKVDFWAELTRGNKMPAELLINTKIGIPRLVRFRNYMNRLPYFSFKSNLFKFRKVKSLQDMKRTLGILIGTYIDRRI